MVLLNMKIDRERNYYLLLEGHGNTETVFQLHRFSNIDFCFQLRENNLHDQYAKVLWEYLCYAQNISPWPEFFPAVKCKQKAKL